MDERLKKKILENLSGRADKMMFDVLVSYVTGVFGFRENDKEVKELVKEFLFEKGLKTSNKE
jgi:hypothetical protein